MNLIGDIVKRGKLNKIKKMIDIVELLQALGLKDRQGKQFGKEFWCLCPNPNHKDNSPSWSINIDPDDSRFGNHNCFSCGYTGNFITLTRDRLSYTTNKEVTNAQALEFIINLFTLNSIDEDSLYDLILEEREQMFLGEEENVIKKSVIMLPAEFQQVKPKDKVYYNYLTGDIRSGGRGIKPELLNKYNIGFCSKGLYTNRVIIPFVQKGELISFVARSIFPTISTKKKNGDEFKICPECGKLNQMRAVECLKCDHDIGSYVPKKARSRYPKGSKMEIMLWALDEIDYSIDYVILVEGAMDKLRLESLGYKNVMCLFGDKISDTQVKLLLEIQERMLKEIKKKLRIFLFPDADKGGDILIGFANTKIKYLFDVLVVELPWIDEDPLDPGNATLKQIKIAFNKVEKLYKVCIRKNIE